MIKVLVVAIAVLMFVGVFTKIRLSVMPIPQEDMPTLSPVPNVEKKKEKERVTIVATGDVVMGRSVNYQMVKYNNPLWPFEKVKDVLSSGDITIANIEAPFVKDCSTTVEGMVFCGREDAAKGLVASGVDVATLANNHISDFGMAGIENTVKVLRDNSIDITGLEGEILYKTVKGTKVAFLAFNDIYGSIPPVLKANAETIERLVGEARKNADIVVVSMHWGVEYRDTPDSRQIELAHLVADAGADLIIGNHPHWIQSDEQYKNTYIKYAHGNLVFDQMWSEETKKGVIGKYIFEDGKLIDKEFTPTYIKDYGQPQILPN
ncbi:MAG: CapA family protein [Patescibacteria group bacterium]